MKERENKIKIANNLPQDLMLENLSDMNSASFGDDSASKSPLDSELKMITNSNPALERPFKDIIKRMQDEIDALIHENAELKSRQSINSSCCCYQNNKGQLEKEERDTKSTDDSKAEDSAKRKDSLSSKVNELYDRIKIMDKENKTLKIEIKKRENYLQQKLQLEIDIKKVTRSNQELQAKLDALDAQINLKVLSSNSMENKEIANNNEEEEIELNKKKILKLSKENNISKGVNQTLVKLLKLKNLQIQTNRILSTENQKDHERARINLEKFETEEKKLLKILEIMMKQYHEIEDHV